MTKRTPQRPETPVTLILWVRDGGCYRGDDVDAPHVKYPEVSVGRTDSKRRVGFAIKMTARASWVLFTLDRVQVTSSGII